MTTAEKIIIGLLVVGVVIVAFVAFRNPKDKDPIIVQNPAGGTVSCNPLDPGFDINGIQNPLCGIPKCDPTKIGYTLSGFPDIDCGFGGRTRR